MRAALVLVALLALLVWPLAGAAEESDADLIAQVERVTRAYRDGRFHEALSGARELVRQVPGDPAARTLYGSIAEYIGEFDEALIAYAEARTLAPDHPAAQYRMGALLVRLGAYDQALNHLDFFVTSFPWEVRWKFLNGQPEQKAEVVKTERGLEAIAQLKVDIVMEKGELAQARTLAREYGLVTPGHDYCADARQGSGRRGDEQFKAFRLAALATPPDADCVWWYGQWLTDEGYVRLAQLVVAEAAHLTTSTVNKRLGERYLRIRLMDGRRISKRAEQLAIIGRQRYLRERDAGGATQVLEEAIRLEPTFPRPYLHLARIAWERNEHESALSWLERALKADPDHWRAHRNLAQALVGLGRYADAEPRLRRALELFADDPGAHLMLARVLYAQGKHDEYVKETRAALQITATWSRQEFPEVRDFLAKYEAGGKVTALPPTPDPRILMGWNQD
jgi:tetratricopeptide (TPR) repeat protein